MNIAIIGAGGIGKAIAHVLEKADTSVSFWDTDEGKRSGTLKDVLQYARVVFFCIPSHALPSALPTITPVLGWGSVVVTVSKGLTGAETPEAMFETCIEPRRFVALMGPMLADELMRDQGGAAVAASASRESADVVRNLFARTALRVETSDDVRGVMLAGVLKNVYAIELGCAQELGLGRNTLGELVSRAVREMAYIVERLGGDERSAYGLPGLGDLVATGFSQDSRNCAFGRALAKGEKPDFMTEGKMSLPHLLTLLGSCVDELPLLAILRDVVIAGKHPRAILEVL